LFNKSDKYLNNLSATIINIIGSGISGLSSACYLAKEGYDVNVFEKNSQIGGRARKLEENGFVFDMGPSWYWMPEVFENFYQHFGKTTSDFYDLKRLSPSYRVFWKENQAFDIPSEMGELEQLFEKLEKGSAKQLKLFLKEAAFKYHTGMDKLVFKPGLSLSEFADPSLLYGLLKMDVLKSMHNHIRKYVKHPFLIELLEFPVLFLGATASNTPALYSLMNYADMKLGTWYPMGGMHKIIEAFESIAKSLGVKFYTDSEVTSVEIKDHLIKKTILRNASIDADIVLNSGDYHHFEQHIIPGAYRQYNDSYWNKRKLAPSCLLYYVGVNKKIKGLKHHNLFFDTDFQQHASDIYTNYHWPQKPLFYVCAPSVTDASVAPSNCENLFLLIPVSTELDSDTDEIREKYFSQMIERIENRTGEKISDHIIYKRSYSRRNFISDYHSFKGNAYGLANTLNQTALLKPKIKSSKIKNLFYTGQLTVPGPGVPPAIISGRVASQLIQKHISNKK
jgi:phytoene desaturase